MRILQACLIGCGMVLVAALVGLVLLVRWWTAPIDIPRVPPPTSPTPNAYEVYKKLAVQMKEKHEQNPQLEAMEQQLSYVSRGSAPLTPELRRYLQIWEPFRREYRKHLNEPSRFPELLQPSTTFPDLSAMRMWARVEAVDSLLAIRERHYARVVDNYRTVLLVSEQMRNGGIIISHLVALACTDIIRRPAVQALPYLSAGECDAIVHITRQWERRRVPVEQAFEAERASHINLLHDFYEGKEKLTPEWFGAGPDVPKRVPPAKWLNLRAAAHELQSLYEMAIRESRKPVVQQAKVPEPRHVVNAILFPMPDSILSRDAAVTTRNRLLAIAAAVRAYRLRHGRYPKTLAEAGVADLNKDPFTGGEFVYKTSPKGFLVYSVGDDGHDDGGKRATRDKSPGDIGLLPYSPPAPASAQQQVPPGPPLWMK